MVPMQGIDTNTGKMIPIQEIGTNKKQYQNRRLEQIPEAMQLWKTVQEKISNSSQPSRKELFVKQVSGQAGKRSSKRS